MSFLAFPPELPHGYGSGLSDRLSCEAAIGTQGLSPQPGLRLWTSRPESEPRIVGQEKPEHPGRGRRPCSSGQGEGLLAVRRKNTGKWCRNRDHQQLGK